MIIIIGLGNPGTKFENTRHNVGFLAVNKIAGNFSAQGGPASGWQFQSSSNAEISQGEIAGEKIILVKPQTFMNDSGKALKIILSKIKDQITNMIVIHDDVDLPVGKIKIVKERGSAGHKGVESIIKNIGNAGLIRIRIGIAPERDVKAKKIVLKNFSLDEQEIINKTLKKICDALNLFITDGLEKTMSQFNAR
ncbi:MAG: aminoacyl-tRNA hydrolase [Candidatus Staskawiczbacteria bacterium]|nr:aminoacyl-tRNA hydrolase [Candidatus Staskawiczbacteria bacterium]